MFGNSPNDLVYNTTHSHPETSNNKHDWNPVKYLNVLHHNRAKSSCDTFSNILQNLSKLPFLSTLDMFGYFH